MTPDDASTMVAALSIGHMVASLIGIFIVDRFGRKRCILGSSVPLVVSWGMIAVADTVTVSIALPHPLTLISYL